jgi:hypothetical protein
MTPVRFFLPALALVVSACSGSPGRGDDGGADAGLGGWDYQRIWSNAAAATAGDPCVPPTSEPYFNVSVAQDWYEVSPGASYDIPFTGWSTGPRDNWQVLTYLSNGSPAVLAYDGGAFWGTSSELGTFAADAGCLPRFAMNNGGGGLLTVELPETTSSGDYAVLSIHSFEDDPTTCYPFVARDHHHEWLVGVYVP